MLKQSILLVVVCAMLLVPAPNDAGAAKFANVTCDSTTAFSLDADSTTGTMSGQTCFKINVRVKTSLLTITLKPLQGTFDLYFGSYSSNALIRLTERNNKLNFAYEIDRRAVYAFKDPPVGNYIIAVVPVKLVSSGSSEFSVKIAARTPPARPPLVSPPSSSSPWGSIEAPTTVDTGVNIDLQAGDQVIFPINRWNCQWLITASATWSGSAEQLAFILKAPTGPELQDPAAPSVRKDGSFSLSFRHTVPSAEAQTGTRGELRLVNLSGGTVTAMVKTKFYPRGNCLSLTAQATARPSPTALSVETPLACTGAPHQIRFKVGQPIYVCTRVDRVRLRDSPAGGLRMWLDPGTTLTITGGPRCAENVFWWKVQTDANEVGWVMDGTDADDKFFICAAQ